MIARQWPSISNRCRRLKAGARENNATLALPFIVRTCMIARPPGSGGAIKSRSGGNGPPQSDRSENSLGIAVRRDVGACAHARARHARWADRILPQLFRDLPGAGDLCMAR